MEIQFTDPNMIKCQKVFTEIGVQTALFMNHYELAEHGMSRAEELNTAHWKTFLMDQQVAEYMDEELRLYNQAQLKKMIRQSTTNDRSVGTAQMIGALQKTLGIGPEAVDGVRYIYSYVPLNHEEQQAPDVRAESNDIFWEED
jgi:hypothetical protein